MTGTVGDHGRDDAEIRRLVALCLSGVALAVLVGTTVVVAAVIGVALVREPVGQAPGALPSFSSPAAVLLFGGTLGGIAAAVATAWWALAPIGNWYRRGMLATVAAFATAVVMLLAIPANVFFGVPGLFILLSLAVVAAAPLARRVIRLSSR
jgi:hypothetical protein